MPIEKPWLKNHDIDIFMNWVYCLGIWQGNLLPGVACHPNIWIDEKQQNLPGITTCFRGLNKRPNTTAIYAHSIPRETVVGFLDKICNKRDLEYQGKCRYLDNMKPLGPNLQ